MYTIKYEFVKNLFELKPPNLLHLPLPISLINGVKTLLKDRVHPKHQRQLNKAVHNTYRKCYQEDSPVTPGVTGSRYTYPVTVLNISCEDGVVPNFKLFRIHL